MSATWVGKQRVIWIVSVPATSLSASYCYETALMHADGSQSEDHYALRRISLLRTICTACGSLVTLHNMPQGGQSELVGKDDMP
jgi:hypothetical protein